jgi:hypothetical protein
MYLHVNAMNLMRGAIFVVLTTIIAACAAPPPPPPPEPLKPKLTVDGEYRGTSTRFQAESRACPHPGLVQFQVFDNHFQFRWDRNTWVDGIVGPDGVVTGGAERITLVGKQTGPKLEADVTNGDCGLHFTVTQRP